MQAAYAKKYAAIADRARLKVVKASEKLRSIWLHEIAPRATVPASLALLLDDELDPQNHAIVARFLQQYRFHMTVVNR